MRQKDRSLLYLLTFTMLLFSFSSIFAAVTVTYQPIPAGFPYNSTGNVITAAVATTEPIAAFDLMTKVRSTVTSAFGVITAVNISSVGGAAIDLSKVNAVCGPGNGVPAGEEDTTRIYGFNCGTAVIMPVGSYNFTFTVTTCCDTGSFVLEDGGTWLVDPDPVNATTMFVNASAAAAAVTTVSGTYRVRNTAPTITNCPTQAWSYNACAIVNYTFTATDPDNACKPAADLAWSLLPGSPGSIVAATGQYQWDPPAVAGICGLHEGTARVTDEYGAFADCHFEISLWTDAPVITYCPPTNHVNDGISEVFIYWGWTADGIVTAVDPDQCPLALQYSIDPSSDPLIVANMVLDPDNGDWSWPTVYGDNAYLGDHSVTINVTDGCITVPCTFSIHVAPTYQVKIEKTHQSLQGHYEFVDITLEHWTEGLGGFDLLIAYNDGLTFLEATPGAILTACGWEYFTYRFGAQGNCGGPCPSGFLRIVAIADMNNGANHPTCYGQNVTGVLATLKFLVTNDRTFECMYVPIQFAWFDCGDNGLSSITGDTLYIARMVYGFDVAADSIFGDPLYGGWQGIEGHPNCMSLLSQKTHPDTVVDFFDGGIDIACADSIDARGDVNLNGIANEIADAVLYTNYFLYGISALPVVGREGAIAASDVNNDGKPLTVGDLVYLLRIIVGDAQPFAKLAPYGGNADIAVFGDKISTTSSETIGALYMTFDVTGDYSVVNHSNMEVTFNRVGDKLNVLVYSGMTNMSNAIPAGTNELLTVTGAELSNVEVSDYYGNLLNNRVEKTALPTQFALNQNIPNPFNPTTKIGLDLPVSADWKIDIYNVNGQLVQSYNGTNIGHVEVTWDASNVSSGVFFYKVTAGSFTETKKMVLMK